MGDKGNMKAWGKTVRGWATLRFCLELARQVSPATAAVGPAGYSGAWAMELETCHSGDYKARLHLRNVSWRHLKRRFSPSPGLTAAWPKASRFYPPPTPFPKSFKCFTCEHASDNYNCNRWAEDKWCPQNTKFCMTVHHFTSHGKSRSVTKRCASREDCHAVGCRHHRATGHTECVSCCEGMICNVEVPTNHSNAVFAMRHTHSASAPPTQPCRVPLLLLYVSVGLVLL
ncbi:hypothetical protein JZ751_027841 [Albula glossodonta]|uniref:Ly6/PLAUR domain-containing protein 6B n=1 Tax=Albula glossodonta TaxID=121402 RepID=A0A8T2PIU2_9TELE|nr:hypothetical protein JZ751_027841 [Albula glossodonta]